MKDTAGQQDATIHQGVTNYTDIFFIYMCIESHGKVGMTHRVLVKGIKENLYFPLLPCAVTDPTKNKILRVQGYHQLKMLHLYFNVRKSFGGNTQMLLRYCKR